MIEYVEVGYVHVHVQCILHDHLFIYTGVNSWVRRSLDRDSIFFLVDTECLILFITCLPHYVNMY